MDIYRDIMYNSAHALDLYVPKKRNSTVVIFVHGGAWLMGDKSRTEPQCKLLAHHGYTVVSCNYTLCGMHVIARAMLFWCSILGVIVLLLNRTRLVYIVGYLCLCIFGWIFYVIETASPQHITDVELVLDWIKDNLHAFADHSKRILIGHSAGAHLACLLASKRYMDVHGVVAISGVYSLSRLNDVTGGDWLLDSAFGPLDDFSKYSPVVNVHQHCPPHLLINAKIDVTLQRHAWDMTLSLKEHGVFVQAMTVPGDHLSVMRKWEEPTNQVVSTILRFITEVANLEVANLSAP